MLMLLAFTVSATPNDLSSLFDGKDKKLAPKTLEQSNVPQTQIKYAKQQNMNEEIQRSGLDIMGHKLMTSLRDGYQYEKSMAGADYGRCQSLIGRDKAYKACIKDIRALKTMGTSGMMAVYVIQGRCNYLAGIDKIGLSYVCNHANLHSCSALSDVNQSIRNDCGSCNGSNLWLRVFAASGQSLRCH